MIGCSSLDEAEDSLNELRNEHPSATHHCYAWRIHPNDPKEFSQDDGEPSGTAGLPILNVLRSHNLINCLMVSIRYYGGTQLGKKGLIEAYSNSAEQSIENARLSRVIPAFRYRIVYPYSLQSAIGKLKNDFTVRETGAIYLENVELILAIPLSEKSAFHSALSALEHRLTACESLGEWFWTE